MTLSHTVVLMIIICVVFLTVVLSLITIALKREKFVHEKGIETYGIISKNETLGCVDRTNKRCYVAYIGNDGYEHEACLNVRTNLPVGRKVKIKYLPDNYEQALFIEQELDKYERVESL